MEHVAEGFSVNNRALGRRPPVAKPALRLSNFLTTVPAHPIAVDDGSGVSFGLDNNDRFGVCVPTGFDNWRRMTTKLLTGNEKQATWEEVKVWYKTQNPNFDENTHADDNGMVIQDFLSYLVKSGEILGFAKVDLTNDEEVRAANYLFLGLLLGLDLQVAQQTQQRQWDYVPGSGDWGGHCVVQVGYDSRGEQVISWQENFTMTSSFYSHQRSEAWVIITKELVSHPDFRSGFDLPKFAQAFTDITGRPFPTSFPGPVTPPPTPKPVEDADKIFAAELEVWLAKRPFFYRALQVNAIDWLTRKGL